MKKILALTALVGLTAGFAQAAYLANWGDPTCATANDPMNDDNYGIPASDILSLKCVQQDGGYYFLMTIQAAPTPSAFAPAYAININNAPGGAGTGNLSYYVAQGLTGIDLIVDAHYDPYMNGGLGGYASKQLHQYIGGSAPKFDEADIDPTVNGLIFNVASATELEWYVPVALIGGRDTEISASTLNSAPMGGTGDITLVTQVPEPTSMALVALGLAAIGLRRKFRK